MLFERSQDPAGKETLVSGLERWWPEKDARCIADRLVGYYQQGRPPEWLEAQKTEPGRIDALIAKGEELIRCPV